MWFQLFVAILLGIVVYVWFFRRRKEYSLPEMLLPDVCWNFCGENYPDEASFIRAVKEYGDGKVNQHWQPDEIVLMVREVILLFSGWVKDEKDEMQKGDYEFLLKADGYSFPASELLYKIHLRLLPYLEGQEECRAAGLTFWEKDESGIPVYLLKMVSPEETGQG